MIKSLREELASQGQSKPSGISKSTTILQFEKLFVKGDTEEDPNAESSSALFNKPQDVHNDSWDVEPKAGELLIEELPKIESPKTDLPSVGPLEVQEQK